MKKTIVVSALLAAVAGFVSAQTQTALTQLADAGYSAPAIPSPAPVASARAATASNSCPDGDCGSGGAKKGGGAGGGCASGKCGSGGGKKGGCASGKCGSGEGSGGGAGGGDSVGKKADSSLNELAPKLKAAGDCPNCPKKMAEKSAEAAASLEKAAGKGMGSAADALSGKLSEFDSKNNQYKDATAKTREQVDSAKERNDDLLASLGETLNDKSQLKNIALARGAESTQNSEVKAQMDPNTQYLEAKKLVKKFIAKAEAIDESISDSKDKVDFAEKAAAFYSAQRSDIDDAGRKIKAESADISSQAGESAQKFKELLQQMQTEPIDPSVKAKVQEEYKKLVEMVDDVVGKRGADTGVFKSSQKVDDTAQKGQEMQAWPGLSPDVKFSNGDNRLADGKIGDDKRNFAALGMRAEKELPADVAGMTKNVMSVGETARTDKARSDRIRAKIEKYIQDGAAMREW